MTYHLALKTSPLSVLWPHLNRWLGNTSDWMGFPHCGLGATECCSPVCDEYEQHILVWRIQTWRFQQSCGKFTNSIIKRILVYSIHLSFSSHAWTMHDFMIFQFLVSALWPNTHLIPMVKIFCQYQWIPLILLFFFIKIVTQFLTRHHCQWQPRKNLDSSLLHFELELFAVKILSF